MRANKQNILDFLKEIKPSLQSDGIATLALFGSFARDEATVYSDIDIAISKCDDYMQSHSAYDYLNQLERIKELLRQTFHRNSDVFDLDSDSPLKTSIESDLIYV